MLALHERYGDARQQYPGDSAAKGITFFDEDKQEDALTPFGVLVEREKAALAKLVPPPQRKRIVAAPRIRLALRRFSDRL